jgi:U4/U6 small nuclear ribonucleoprotein PRP4
MRSLKNIYTIPAHLSNVSDVKFFHGSEGLPASMTAVNGNGSASSGAAGTPMDEDIDMKVDDKEGSGSKPSVSSSSNAVDPLTEWKYRSGLYFASSGYDGLVKLWSADDWQLLRTLSTDGGKVMSVDLSNDGKYLASGTYNRNFQLFAREDV